MPPLQGYFLWFTFFILYNLVLIVTVVFSQELSTWSGVGYRVALFFAALATWPAYRTGLDFRGVSKQKQAVFSSLYLIGVMGALLLHVVFFEIPKPASENWIFWYSNQPIAFTYIFFMFLTGWTFAFGMIKKIFSLPGIILKLRSFLLAFPALTLPFAAYFYFGADSVSDLNLVLPITIVALLSFVLGNVGISVLIKLKRYYNTA